MFKGEVRNQADTEIDKLTLRIKILKKENKSLKHTLEQLKGDSKSNHQKEDIKII